MPCEVCLHGFNALLMETTPQAGYATSVGGVYDTFGTAYMYEQTGRVRWSRLVGQGGGRDKVYSGRPIMPPESCLS